MENQSESLTDGGNRSPGKSEITVTDSVIDDEEPETVLEDRPFEQLAEGSGNSWAWSTDIKNYRSSPKPIRHDFPTGTNSRSSLARHHNERLSRTLAPFDLPEKSRAFVLTDGSELCVICHATLLPPRVRIKGSMVQIESYLSLEQRALHNCPICKLFLVAMPASAAHESLHVKQHQVFVRVYKDEHGDQGWQPSLRLEYTKLKSTKSPSSLLLGIPLDNALYVDTRITVVVRLERCLGGVVPSNFMSRINSPARKFTGSTPLNYSKQWLENCTAHEECKMSGYLPTRLIDASRFPEANLCLCNGEKLPKDTKYLTLSHCWGGNLSFRLLESNLSAMERAISFEDLPKTFQDAVKVVRSLGASYLWIDALCIVQDSAEDWRRESAKMGMVYANSYCNLSATASSDSSGGLLGLQERNPAGLVQLMIRRPKDYIEEHYYAYNPQMFHMEVNDAPLNHRAWVLQERLLSPRNLHFGDRQLFWECRNMTACEMFPNGLPSKMRDTDIKRKFATALKPPVQHNPSTSKAMIEELHRYWGDLVQIYCNSNLTCSSDRLVAISGLASNFYASFQSQGMFTTLSDHPAYLAGLWNHDLTSQLLWKVTQARTRLVYTAPSWSWASIEGEFNFLFKQQYQGFRGTSKDLITVENSWMQLLDSSKPFGQVINGRLEVLGKLTIASYNKEEYSKQAKLKSIRSPEDNTFYDDMLSMSWDAGTSPNSSGIVYLLPIRARGDRTRVLINILHRMAANFDCGFERKPWDPAKSGDFKDGYIEGILLDDGDNAPSTSKREDWVIPKQFRRVGKWETLAIEKLLEEVDFMDKRVNVAEQRPSERFDEDMKEEKYPRYTIAIV